MMKIIRAESKKHIDMVRELFTEYEEFLGVDLCFQDFEKELESLPGPYGPPDGVMFIALKGEDAAGCVAVKSLGEGRCEMKRLFVRPAYRRRGLGRELAEKVIAEAAGKGYSAMRLDTLSRLKEAMNLYLSLGFKEIPPYYHNPLPDVVFLELEL